MQRLSEKFDGYTISSILKEYCADLRELESEERACAQQPISRYESDFVSVTNAKELLALYRRDYIKKVDEADFISGKDQRTGTLGPFEVDSLLSAKSSAHESLVTEFRQYFAAGDRGQKFSDLELLSKVDAYLSLADRSKRGYMELLKSVPKSAFDAYKEKLTKKAENNAVVGISLQDVSAKKDTKESGRRRGGFKRKLVCFSAVVSIVCQPFDCTAITELYRATTTKTNKDLGSAAIPCLNNLLHYYYFSSKLVPSDNINVLTRLRSTSLLFSMLSSKQPNATLAVGDVGDSISVPTALLDGDRIIKKFRRRRRLGVLVTSNAAIAAAKKAAASGIPMTVTTTARTANAVQRKTVTTSASASSSSLSTSHAQCSSQSALITSRGQ